MNSEYYIKNIFNLTSYEAIKTVMLNSHFILTMRGNFRDVISHLGQKEFNNSQIIDMAGDVSIVEEAITNFKVEAEQDLKIAIDISLIDRKTLASIFSLIAKLAYDKNCSIYVVYSLAKYAPPSGKLGINNLVKPVSSFFSGWSNRPGLPVMSIVGLGYERDKAIGAIEYLESSKTCLYIPRSNEEQYYNDVVNENKGILESVIQNDQFSYKVESPSEAIFSLDSLLTANKNRYKVVLFPFGPKIFYALSLVASIPHPEASVWYVSGEDGDSDSSQDREVSDLVGFHFNISRKN
ncbi:hypothetical protein DET47_101294 [Shewanella putrefaciens]|nr:hypothetical protein DET47_101294 [Shewanella putrefaciens]